MARPTTQSRNPVSEALIALRTALGETQQQFAAHLNTAITTIARYETNRPPSGAILISLAKMASENGLGKEAATFQEAFARENGIDRWGKDMLTRELWRKANYV